MVEKKELEEKIEEELMPEEDRIDTINKLKEEIEEYDELIEVIEQEIKTTDSYEIELRDMLRRNIATLKRGRTAAYQVYQSMLEMGRKYDGINDFKLFIQYIKDIDEPYEKIYDSQIREDYLEDLED